MNQIEKLFRCRIKELEEQGRVRTAKCYESTLKSVMSYSELRSVRTIDVEFIKGYYHWLRNERGVKRNTISFYMRILRALLNNKKLFSGIFVGNEPTAKRAISKQDINRLANIQLSGELAFARNMFLLSFVLRGMSPVDMVKLKKENLQNGVLTYVRSKTGQTLRIKWTVEMQSIVDQMPHSENGYLLPIIKDEHKFYVQYRSFVAVVNRNLKKVALEVGLNIPLTMYVARHSWATIAMSKGIVTPVISRALGHTNERTTRIYLAQLDMTEQIDHANAVVLEELCLKLSKE